MINEIGYFRVLWLYLCKKSDTLAQFPVLNHCDTCIGWLGHSLRLPCTEEITYCLAGEADPGQTNIYQHVPPDLYLHVSSLPTTENGNLWKRFVQLIFLTKVKFFPESNGFNTDFSHALSLLQIAMTDH